MPGCFRFCTPDSSSLTIAPVGTFSSTFRLSSNGVDLGLDVN